MEQYFALWHRCGYADGVIYEGKDLGICPICKPSEGAVSLTMTGSLKFDDWSAGECTTCNFRFILPHRGESHIRFIVHETYQAKRKFAFEQAVIAAHGSDARCFEARLFGNTDTVELRGVFPIPNKSKAPKPFMWYRQFPSGLKHAVNVTELLRHWS